MCIRDSHYLFVLRALLPDCSEIEQPFRHSQYHRRWIAVYRNHHRNSAGRRDRPRAHCTAGRERRCPRDRIPPPHGHFDPECFRTRTSLCDGHLPVDLCPGNVCWTGGRWPYRGRHRVGRAFLRDQPIPHHRTCVSAGLAPRDRSEDNHSNLGEYPGWFVLVTPQLFAIVHEQTAR